MKLLYEVVSINTSEYIYLEYMDLMYYAHLLGL